MTELKNLTIPCQEAEKIRLAVFDFDGVFTDNSVWVSDEGLEFVRCYRGDGIGLKSLAKSGVIPFVLSTEPNPIVSIRCKKMQVPFLQGLNNKSKTLEKLTHKMNITFDMVSYTGNDINDIGCLKLVSVPIAVQDSSPEIFNFAKYITAKPGGCGAVREVCDWIISCKAYGKV